MQQGRREERAIGDLFNDLSRDMSRLVRDEVTLAKKELTQKTTKAGIDVAWLVAAGSIIYGGFLVLLATAVIALAIVLDWWLSALIIGAVTIAIGGAIAWYYWTKLSSINPTPQKTVETLQEDKEWMKEQAR